MRQEFRPSWSVRRSATATTAAAVMLLSGAAAGSAAGPSPSPGAGSTAPAVVVGNTPAYNWATFHLGPRRQGYAANSPLSTASAGTLGVGWATNLYTAALDSPVVYYDSGLGKTLAYIGTEHGDLIAVNVASGRIAWSTWLGSPIRATPVAINGAVWAGTLDSPRIYKLNAATGAIDCSLASPSEIEGTPVAGTPPGGVSTVYFNTSDTASSSGPVLAVKASNCALEWSFTRYASTAGSWDPLAYAVDATGRPLIVFGTADPDSRVYAIDARTGAGVWRYAAYNPPPGDYDIGAGVTISPPKANGFAGGVAYVPTKYGIMYALNLTTGALIWSLNFDQALSTSGGGISMAALDGKNLVFGYRGGLVDVNAVTGKVIWSSKLPVRFEVDSSPAIAGAPGSEIVAFGDLSGGLDVDSLATGAQLYHYQTGNYITASPAVSDGNILVASADGFLYDFAAGGANATTLPATAISHPADSSTIASPGGAEKVTGSASDQAGVGAVMVAVQAGGPGGAWWDASSRTWVSGPVGNPAALGSPGGASSAWSFSYPVPAAGGTYEVTAYAVAKTGQADIKGARTGFVVSASAKAPVLAARPAFVAPGGSLTVAGGGFAAREKVTISLTGRTLATATATATGHLPNTRVTIPVSVPFGRTSLTAKGTSGRTASAAVTVGNSWVELGNDPGHTNFEPNDSTLFDNITPGGNIFLDPAWLYQAASPIDTAPAVAGGVAYTAASGGQLTAIDVHNGAPLWTWAIPSRAALDGSAAVDPAARRVFVGASDGTLDAISTSTGKRAWSATVGGDVSAPVYGSGKVYVTSSTGMVEAVSEATGARVWSRHLPAAIKAAPALDPVRGTLVVGEASGHVLAVNSASGATRWTFSAGGAITAAATVSRGAVYFGSGDFVYAVSETSGAKTWSYRTGGAVTDTPAITSVGTRGVLDVMIGSDDGTLYVLHASNGSLAWSLPFGQPIVGVAIVKTVVIFDTSAGWISASRSYQPLPLWRYKTHAGLTSPPVIVDGAVYVGAGDWNLYAFTTYGQQPEGLPSPAMRTW